MLVIQLGDCDAIVRFDLRHNTIPMSLVYIHVTPVLSIVPNFAAMLISVQQANSLQRHEAEKITHRQVNLQRSTARVKTKMLDLMRSIGSSGGQ